MTFQQAELAKKKLPKGRALPSLLATGRNAQLEHQVPILLVEKTLTK